MISLFLISLESFSTYIDRTVGSEDLEDDDDDDLLEECPASEYNEIILPYCNCLDIRYWMMVIIILPDLHY